MSLFDMFRRRNDRKSERDYYQYTQEKAIKAAKQRESVPSAQTQADPEWYKPAAIVVAVLITLVVSFFAQWIAVSLHNMKSSYESSYFGYFGIWHLHLLFILLGFGVWYFAKFKFHAIWYNNNAGFIHDDMGDVSEKDGYIQTLDHLAANYHIAPDEGMGFDGPMPSAIVAHVNATNKGIKPQLFPKHDPTVPGQVKTVDGVIVKVKKPVFDKKLGEAIFNMSGVPKEERRWYDLTDYEYNPEGLYYKKKYKTLADVVNNTFYPLDTEPVRPAGIYFYEHFPIHVILIAITRGGKGQTYIESMISIWTRIKKKWNILMLDPKGELFAKFYYSATKRGMEMVSFNLAQPHLTSKYNPLMVSLQEFRRNNPTEGSAIIEAVLDTILPVSGDDIWNPSARNMFKRLVYLLFDYYIEKETYLRYVGRKNNEPLEVTMAEIDKMYGRLTLYNIYDLVGKLSSRVSTDPALININPDLPPASKKDLMTVLFDAMLMLPKTSLRVNAMTANNALASVAKAEQTIACIYATLLTALSTYDDETTIALLSGSPEESFDITGLSFPRRFGFRIDPEYLLKSRLTDENYRWSCYRDAGFTDAYKGSDFTHEGVVPPTGWIWGYFAGIFEDDVTYLKVEIIKDGIVAKTFRFRFVKGYRTIGGISYFINPVTKERVVKNGNIFTVNSKGEDKIYTFRTKVINPVRKTYDSIEKDIVSSSLAYYSEKPKMVAFIAPPHRSNPQKHILTMVDQIMNEHLGAALKVKEDKKPVYGINFMGEEFVNVRSGDKGIADLDKKVSIGLAQDLRMTFVIQAFQQIKSLYGEEVAGVIWSNSAIKMFLKSDDLELIKQLAEASGDKYRLQTSSKSVSRKKGDLITTAEPAINYQYQNNKSTTLEFNDLMFLAGRSPGNAVTFVSNDMPIVNKLSTIMPMAAALHRQLPQEVYNIEKDASVPYADTTIPVEPGRSTLSYVENLIDVDRLVRERTGQAVIAKQFIENALSVSDRYDLGLTVDSEDLAPTIMNYVYEEYDKTSADASTYAVGGVREEYWKIAEEMINCISTIGNVNLDRTARLHSTDRLRDLLYSLLDDDEIAELVDIYRNERVDNVLHFDVDSIKEFVRLFYYNYPKPSDLETETQDVVEIASNAKPEDTDGYVFNKSKYLADPRIEKPFDFRNPTHARVLSDVGQDMVQTKKSEVYALKLIPAEDSVYYLTIDGVNIARYKHVINPNDSDEEGFEIKLYVDDADRIDELIIKSASTLDYLTRKIHVAVND